MAAETNWFGIFQRTDSRSIYSKLKHKHTFSTKSSLLSSSTLFNPIAFIIVIYFQRGSTESMLIPQRKYCSGSILSKNCINMGGYPKKGTLAGNLKGNVQKKWVEYVELSSSYMLCRKLFSSIITLIAGNI